MRPARVTRRAACSLGAGLAAMAWVGAPAGRACAAERRAIRYVLTDRRYAPSLDYGATLARQGAERLEVTDGLTHLWREALVRLWREQAGAIAGLTQRGTWACIAEQARSCGRRSVLVGLHALDAGGNASGHLVTASAPALAGADALETCGAAWPRVMAALAMQHAPKQAVGADRQFPAASPAKVLPPVSLVSWVIA